MSGVLLTIAIPTYNRLKWLRLSLEIILQQLDALPAGIAEVVVSDNCSTDGTTEYLREIASGRSDFRVNRWPENIGGEANFYRLPSLSRGRYLYMIGDDDFLEPGAIAKICDELRFNPDYLVLNFSVYDSSMTVKKWDRCIPGQGDVVLLSPDTVYDRVPHMVMGFLSAWVGRREFFNCIPADVYDHYVQWGASLMVDRYVGVRKFSDGRLIYTPLLKAKRGDQEFYLASFDYGEWFLNGGAEVLNYAVANTGLPVAVARRRKRELLRSYSMKRIPWERSEGTFNRRKCLHGLYENYSEFLEYWLLCVPVSLIPGIGLAVRLLRGLLKK
jgi:glycosyltransferase involved in cell wall biosynthesis